jgi:hypothetical protein
VARGNQSHCQEDRADPAPDLKDELMIASLKNSEIMTIANIYCLYDLCKKLRTLHPLH